MPAIRVELPAHLRTLARIPGHEVALDVASPLNITAVLDALEAAYPMLCGTIRNQVTGERRAFLRFFACQQDVSLDPPDTLLPDAIVKGAEPLIILGAVAGGLEAVARQTGRRTPMRYLVLTCTKESSSSFPEKPWPLARVSASMRSSFTK